MANCKRETSVKDSSDLFDAAITVAAEDFRQLLKNVIHLSDREAGEMRSLRRTGKLITVPPIGETIVIGDIHGDLESLKYIVRHSGFMEKTGKKQNIFMIFLGDYGDRGPYSPEVYYVVLRLKQLFPENVILMRGNHEGPGDLLAYPHDLPSHLRRKFGGRAAEVYERLREFFDRLYTAVMIKDRYILLHGGVPSQASTIEDIAYAHLKHPREPHLEEILWSDPYEGIKGTCASPRGAGRLFGKDITYELLEMLHVNLLIRGHQSSDEGFKMNHNGKVLTLFSRRGPPYHNTQGAYLTLDLSEEVKNARQLTAHVHKF